MRLSDTTNSSDHPQHDAKLREQVAELEAERATLWTELQRVRLECAQAKSSLERAREQATVEQERNLRTIFDTMTEGVALNEIVYDDNGEMVDYRVLQVNPAFYGMADYRGEPVVGARATALYGMTPETIRTFWESHRHKREVAYSEFISPLNQRCFLIATSPFVDGKFVTTFMDITERRRLEDERVKLEVRLHHAQKMEAIGTLAAGVAHDFNNIMSGVMSGLATFELDPEPLAARFGAEISEMKELIKRGSDLTKQLLGMGRRGKMDPRPLDLAAVAETAVAMFGRTRRDIQINQVYSAQLRSVLMDHSQLEQVLLNLLLNAGRAMPNGGRLTVSAADLSVTHDAASKRGLPEGNYVKLVVADTGIGMDEATQARVFEPFFTTKPTGEGAGLGLASVYGIVKNHGGAITVRSELGQGAEFTILLPSTERAVARDATRAPIIKGHETILLIDDEPQVLKLTERMLRSMGYEILPANSGRAAIEIARHHGERIAIVILDLTMPELSGAATYEALRPVLPHSKVLISSGFAGDGQVQALLAGGCSDFIQKPYDVAELSRKLRSLV